MSWSMPPRARPRRRPRLRPSASPTRTAFSATRRVCSPVDRSARCRSSSSELTRAPRNCLRVAHQGGRRQVARQRTGGRRAAQVEGDRGPDEADRGDLEPVTEPPAELVVAEQRGADQGRAEPRDAGDDRQVGAAPRQQPGARGADGDEDQAGAADDQQGDRAGAAGGRHGRHDGRIDEADDARREHDGADQHARAQQRRNPRRHREAGDGAEREDGGTDRHGRAAGDRAEIRVHDQDAGGDQAVDGEDRAHRGERDGDEHRAGVAAAHADGRTAYAASVANPAPTPTPTQCAMPESVNGCAPTARVTSSGAKADSAARRTMVRGFTRHAIGTDLRRQEIFWCHGAQAPISRGRLSAPAASAA